MESTFIMIKPDGVKNGHAKEIVRMIADLGLDVFVLDFKTITAEEIKKHYNEQLDKPWYNDLEAFMTSGPSLFLIAQGENVIEKVREKLGSKYSNKAKEGTIRNLFGNYEIIYENAAHASDSIDSYYKETGIFFSKPEDKQKLDNYKLPYTKK